ncbi:MAG: lysophospholipid acyltransferase family protein [candidate division Zixibacteria bacterium]|nr:lysophospholipid acyltransferase family protein [candidate division Zixibacteria bacterium]
MRYRLEYITLLILRWIANVLPASMASRAGAALGSLVGFVWRSRRAIAEDNVRRALGYSENSIEPGTIATETFRNLGRTTFEILRLTQLRHEDLLQCIDGREAAPWLEWAHQQGKGALLVSGHFGNWELLGAWIRAMGYAVDFVVKPVRNPLVDRLYNQCRASMDVGIIHTQVATKGILKSLQAKRFVAILADQYSGAEGIDVEFFGRPASTPRGPAVLALKFGCPLLTGVLERLDGGRYVAHVDGPIEYSPTGNQETDVRAITGEIAQRLEAHIRKTPSQWLWTHRRWRE